jgi:rhodanese-related sulfurtransferase
MTLKDLINKANSLVPKISYQEYAKKPKEYLLIDVREGMEIEETGSIPNSINIPRGLIEMRGIPSNDNSDLDFNTPMIVYCGGGSRASLAGRTLKEIGFKHVYNLQGGYRGWKDCSA